MLPAFYGIPIIIGKYHNSCRDSVEKLLQEEAIVISDQKKLVNDLLDLFQNEEKAKKMGLKAKLTLTKNSQSIKYNLEMIERVF